MAAVGPAAERSEATCSARRERTALRKGNLLQEEELVLLMGEEQNINTSNPLSGGGGGSKLRSKPVPKKLNN